MAAGTQWHSSIRKEKTEFLVNDVNRDQLNEFELERWREGHKDYYR